MTETVTIACKLPHGLHLDLFAMRDEDEQTLLGARTVKKAYRTGTRYTVKGIGRRGDGPGMAYGFALTHGIPKDHWDAWLAANGDSDVVKNGLIFAHVKAPDVQAHSRENENEATGLEPLDPQNMPKEFRGKVETAEESPTKKLTG